MYFSDSRVRDRGAVLKRVSGTRIFPSGSPTFLADPSESCLTAVLQGLDEVGGEWRSGRTSRHGSPRILRAAADFPYPAMLLARCCFPFLVIPFRILSMHESGWKVDPAGHLTHLTFQPPNPAGRLWDNILTQGSAVKVGVPLVKKACARNTL